MQKRRVVVTGLGLVTPVGCGVEPAWKNLLSGHSGARRINTFETDDLACKIAPTGTTPSIPTAS
jgi:3-oxoacyl-[acyl-carrier-protein] synthase II